MVEVLYMGNDHENHILMNLDILKENTQNKLIIFTDATLLIYKIRGNNEKIR